MLKLQSGRGFPANYRVPRKSGYAIYYLKRKVNNELIDALVNSRERAHIHLEAIRNDLLQYERVRAGRIQNDSYRLAVETTAKAYRGVPKVTPMPVESLRTVSDIPWSHSPGLPYRLEGYTSKREAFDASVKSVKQIFKKEHHVFPPCMAFARSHISTPEEPKVRAVWGYPMDMFLIEAKFFYPLLEKILSSPHPLAWGYEMMNGGMKFINAKALENKTYLCLDWKMYDKTVPAFIIQDSFEILKKRFSPLSPLMTRLWRMIEEYFINTPVRLADGSTYQKLGGVPSGSCFTQLIDSVCNQVIVHYICNKMDLEPPDFEIFQGDDSILMWKREFEFDLDRARSIAADELQLIVNMKKSVVTNNKDEINFLGYRNENGMPVKTMEDWMLAFALPERQDETEMDTIARAVGLAYANCGVNDSFHHLMEDYVLESCERIEMKELKFSPSMERMLKMIGIELPLTHKIPDQLELVSRLFAMPVKSQRPKEVLGFDFESDQFNMEN